MSNPDKFPKIDNTKEGIKARLEKVKKDRKERELSVVCEEFLPLQQERYVFQFYGHRRWIDFMPKFAKIIETLLSLKYFGEDDEELKTECQKVLVLLNNQDKSQSVKYSELIEKLDQFFIKNKIYVKGRL